MTWRVYISVFLDKQQQEEIGYVRDKGESDVTASTSAIWKNHISVANTPDGFTVRTTVPANPDGVDVMLEQWEAGSEEPPHCHPGDDMTVVVEGKMAIRFYTRSGRRTGP